MSAPAAWASAQKRTPKDQRTGVKSVKSLNQKNIFHLVNFYQSTLAFAGVIQSFLRGRRSYLINRMPHSSHIAALKDNGFSILSCNTIKAELAASANEIRVQHISSDLDLKGVYIVATLSKS
jgi:hypothetical protein